MNRATLVTCQSLSRPNDPPAHDRRHGGRADPGWTGMARVLLTALWFIIAATAGADRLLWQGLPEKKAVKCEMTHAGEQFSLLRVLLTDERDRLHVEVTGKHHQGKAVYSSRMVKNVNGDDGLEQLLDLLPQLPGTYELEISGKGASCAVLLEELAPLDAFVPGEAPGELVVTGAGGVPLTVSPDRFTIKHPEFKKGMDKGITAPNGDVMFRLPPGYWNLRRINNGTENARLIPVNSGGRTTVRWANTPDIDLEPGGTTAARRIEIRSLTASPGSDLLKAVFALPPGLASAPPTLEQLEACERFLPAEPIALEPSTTPLHLVLLLDSSGSMKKSMKTAIEAVVRFIEGLPADAVVEVIDFDTKARPVKAKSRAELIKAVRGIKPDGATALRDSILLGLDRLKNAERPALVVFTDGFDANHNDTGPGSKATETEVFARLKAARIPVFTIGFGAGADAVTLGRLADFSGGLAQKADEQNLGEVFARLEATVAREYVLTCRRPAKPGRGNRPVLSLCVDTSGSMDGRLAKAVPGSRRAIARKVLHALLSRLPAEVLVQVLDFDAKTEITQTATANRARAHAGIAAFGDGGGTDVIKAVEVALEGLLAVPSNRRYMLFLTDAAIKPVSAGDREKFDRLLGRLKDENIHSVWVGLVGKGDSTTFVETSKASGGEAIIADDFARLQQTIDALLQKVGEPVDTGRLPFELVWRMPQPDAAPIAVSGNGLFELPPPTVGSATDEVVDSLQIATAAASPVGAVLPVASESPSVGASSLPTAAGTPAAAPANPNTARLQVPLGVQSENRACRFTVKELTLYDTLDGVKAPARHLFAAFSLEAVNILPEQDVVTWPDGSQHPATWIGQSGREATVTKAVPPYQIADLRRHLFLRWNANPGVPCSPAGWLLGTSLPHFGSHEILVRPGKPATGTVVFLVPDDQGLTDGAVDFFDATYGHLSITIAGRLPPADTRATTLPEKPTGKLGTAFQLTVTGTREASGTLAGAIAGPHLAWTLVDGVIESKVQALLDLDPRARMHLLVPTDAGPVRRPLSPVTALLPHGFYDRVRVTPGATNPIRQAFLLPVELAAIASGTLCIDMKGDDTLVPLNPAAPRQDDRQERAWTAVGNGLKLRLNAHGRCTTVAGKKGDWYIADVTAADLPDQAATRIDKLLFLGRADLKDQGFALKPGERLVKQDANKAGAKGLGSFATTKEAAGTQVRIGPDPVTRSLLFGATEHSVVPDGQELRFVVVFPAPPTNETRNATGPATVGYLLAAEGIPLSEPLSSAPCATLPTWLTAVNDEVCPALPEVFEKQLASRLRQIAAVRRAQSRDGQSARVVDEDGRITEVPASVRPPLLHPEPVPADGKFKIEVSLEVEPIGDSAAVQAGAAAAALSGGSRKNRVVKLLHAQVPAADLARGPVEIVYAETAGDGGKALQATLVGHWGVEPGRERLDLRAWKPVRETIIINGGKSGSGEIGRDLDEKALPDRIHSLVVGVPDLSASATTDLTARWQAGRPTTVPDHLSLWQWFAHARLAGFISAQTAFEERVAAQLGVTLNRTARPRILVLSGAGAASASCDARLDLVQVQPVVEGEETAANAFRLAAGLFVSELEAKILGGPGVFQFWGNNRLQLVADSGRSKNAWLKFAAKRGVDERVIKAIRATRSVVLFPQKPAEVRGKPFWAWLEIDPKTYETIGVLETGERGALAGDAIVQALIPDGAGIALGFWKGAETAVWGMSAFILRGDTAAAAAAATERLIGDLSEHLGNVGDSFEISCGDASVDLLSGKFTLAGFSSDGDYSPWDGYKGFVTGFNAGASWYLGRARAAGQ